MPRSDVKAIAEFCDRSVGLGIAALLLFTPLAFGAVDTWATFDLEIAVFAIGCLWLTARVLKPAPRPRTGLEIPIAVFIALVLFQLAPLPKAVLRVVSPPITALYAETVPGFEGPAGPSFEQWLLDKDAARSGAPSPAAPHASPGGGTLRMPLSYSPSETLDRLLLFFAYALVYLLVADRYRDPGKARRLIVWIVFVGVGIAIEGIFQKLTWNGKILWFRRPPGGANPFGPFVNPNHFAGYMELVVPMTLGLLLTLLASRTRFGYRLGRRRGAVPSTASEPSSALRERELEQAPEILLPWTETNATAKAVLLAFLLVLSIASITLSLSRGGLLATFLTFILFGGALLPPALRGRARWGALAVAAVVLVAVVGLAGWLGGSAISRRVATFAAARSEASFTSRADLWLRSLRLVRDHPLLGAGLGGFEKAFYRYTTPSAHRIWQQAHNDYVQLATEVGLLGLIPALAALALFFRGSVLPALRDRARRDRYLVIGLLMALASILLHSFVDFSLQIPAVGFLFVVIGGLLTALSSPSRVQGPRGERPGSFARSVPPLGAALLAVLAVVTFSMARKRVGAIDLINEATQLTDSTRALELFEKADLTTPAHPVAAQAYADEALYVFDAEYRPDPRKVPSGRPILRKAEDTYRALTAMAPVSSYGWWGLGEVYVRLSVLDRLEQESTLETLKPASEKDLGFRPRLALASLRTARLLEPTSTGMLDDLARLYLQEGLREPGLEAIRTAMQMQPELGVHDFGPVAAIPNDVYHAIVDGMEAASKSLSGTDAAAVLKDLGEMAEQRRDYEGAQRRFREAIALSHSPLLTDSLALDLGKLLQREKRYTEAEAEFTRALANPEVAWRAWVALGELRSMLADHHGALQAFRAAASLAPEDEKPALRIAREAMLAGERAAAESQLRYIIGSQARALEARAMLVELLRSEGKSSEALAQAKALLALDPSRPEFRRLAAELEDRGSRPSADGSAR